jgi:hypothetical protein
MLDGKPEFIKGDDTVRLDRDDPHAIWDRATAGRFNRGLCAPTTTQLPTDATKRKQRPIVRGVLDYFPDALMEVAHCSWVGNEQHNRGEPLHWAKEKSTDEADALVRHLLQRGTLDGDGVRHSAKVAWRALALLQREIEEGEA